MLVTGILNSLVVFIAIYCAAVYLPDHSDVWTHLHTGGGQVSAGKRDARSSTATSSGVESAKKVIPEHVVMYRYGDTRLIPKDYLVGRTISQALHDELVYMARDYFKDVTIARIVWNDGRRFNCIQCGSTVTRAHLDEYYLVFLNEEERFMFPARYVGEVVRTWVHRTSDWSNNSAEHFQEVWVTTLSIRPRVFEITNLVTESECDEMVDYANTFEGNFRKSVIGGDSAQKGQYDDALRNSEQVWIGPANRNDIPIYVDVRARTFELMQIPTDLGEDTQVVKYVEGAHFFSHMDYTDASDVVDNPYYLEGGNRYATIIYYLNDVEEGGETVFPFANNTLRPKQREAYWEPVPGHPELGNVYYGVSSKEQGGLVVKPKKGRSVMFYSLKEQNHMQGAVDHYSLHAGCDVVRGVKYMANQWLRNKRVKLKKNKVGPEIDALYDWTW